MTDLDFLHQALQLAAQGASLVSPNPIVGSLVVNNGQIVGRGYHRFDDFKHAEVWALEEAGPRARGATVYVNLEPCCHRGPGKRTPPCVQALINAGVARVVASMVDPNPAVNGQGFSELRQAGIAVSIGDLEEEATRLNEKYVGYVRTGRPFVHLKLASSLDGRIATRKGESKWITGEEARAASQALRHQYDTLLVGINTVIADNPLLSDRTGLPRHRPLQRVVLDRSLRIPVESQLVRTARELPLLVFTSEPVGDPDWAKRRLRLMGLGVEVKTVDGTGAQLSPRSVLEELGRLRLISLIVEGGSEVAASFLTAGLVDKVTMFFAPKILGGRDAIPAVGGSGIEALSEAIELIDVQLVHRGGDWEVTGYPVQKA